MSVIAICIYVGKIGITTNLLLEIGDTCSMWHRTNHTDRRRTVSLGVNPYSRNCKHCIQPQAVRGCSELLHVEIKDRNCSLSQNIH